MNFQALLLTAAALTPPDLYQCVKAKRRHIKEHPECAMCGSLKYLEAHHIIPVHHRADLASDPNNLITLCDGVNGSNSACHRHIGHLGNFRSGINPYIREQCILNRFYLEKTGTRPYIFSYTDMIEEYASAMMVTADTLYSRVFSNINRVASN